MALKQPTRLGPTAHTRSDLSSPSPPHLTLLPVRRIPSTGASVNASSIALHRHLPAYA
jgi:hypothetical protein